MRKICLTLCITLLVSQLVISMCVLTTLHLAPGEIRHTTSNMDLQQQSETSFYRWVKGYLTSDGFLKDQEKIDDHGNYTPTTLAHVYNMALAGLCAISQNDKITAQLIG